VRKSFPITIPPGLTWPGVADGSTQTDAVRPYRFLRIDNRGAAAVVVGLDGRPGSAPVDYWDLVPAGSRVVRNVGGEHDAPARALQLLNIDPVNTASLFAEISDSPIIDIRSDLKTGLPGGTPTVVGGTRTPAAGLAAPSDALDVLSFVMGYDGAAWDPLRTVSALGAGLGVLLSSGPPLVGATQTSAVNTAQTLTVPGVAGQRIRLVLAVAIASGGGSGGNIQDGAANIFGINATGGGEVLPFGEGGLALTAGNSLNVTMGAAGAGFTTTLSVAYFIA
jgi:hypothetical protein